MFLNNFEKFSSLLVLKFVVKFVSALIVVESFSFKSPSDILNASVSPEKFLISISVLSAKNLKLLFSRQILLKNLPENLRQNLLL